MMASAWKENISRVVQKPVYRNTANRHTTKETMVIQSCHYSIIYAWQM
jgi:hypothetical protein